jgi:hypothetical protein
MLRKDVRHFSSTHFLPEASSCQPLGKKSLGDLTVVASAFPKIHLIDKRGYTPYTSAHIKRVLAITEGANLRSLIYLMPRVRRFEGIEGLSERGKNSMRERNGCFSARIA